MRETQHTCSYHGSMLLLSLIDYHRTGVGECTVAEVRIRFQLGESVLQPWFSVNRPSVQPRVQSDAPRYLKRPSAPWLRSQKPDRGAASSACRGPQGKGGWSALSGPRVLLLSAGPG